MGNEVSVMSRVPSCFLFFFNLPIFFRFIFYYCFINVTRWCYKVLNSSSNTHHSYLKYINKNNYITLLNKVSLRQLESWWSGFLKFRDPFLNICFLNGTVSWLQVDTTLAYTSTGFESHGCVGSFCSKAYSPCALQLLPMVGMHVRLTGKKNKTITHKYTMVFIWIPLHLYIHLLFYENFYNPFIFPTAHFMCLKSRWCVKGGVFFVGLLFSALSCVFYLLPSLSRVWIYE